MSVLGLLPNLQLMSAKSLHRVAQSTFESPRMPVLYWRKCYVEQTGSYKGPLSSSAGGHPHSSFPPRSTPHFSDPDTMRFSLSVVLAMTAAVLAADPLVVNTPYAHYFQQDVHGC